MLLLDAPSCLGVLQVQVGANPLKNVAKVGRRVLLCNVHALLVGHTPCPRTLPTQTVNTHPWAALKGLRGANTSAPQTSTLRQPACARYIHVGIARLRKLLWSPKSPRRCAFQAPLSHPSWLGSVQMTVGWACETGLRKGLLTPPSMTNYAV